MLKETCSLVVAIPSRPIEVLLRNWIRETWARRRAAARAFSAVGCSLDVRFILDDAEGVTLMTDRNAADLLVVPAPKKVHQLNDMRSPHDSWATGSWLAWQLAIMQQLFDADARWQWYLRMDGDALVCAANLAGLVRKLDDSEFAAAGKAFFGTAGFEPGTHRSADRLLISCLFRARSGGDYHCQNSPVHPDEAFVLFNRLAVRRLLAFAAAQAPPWPSLLPPSTLAKALPLFAQHCRTTRMQLVQLNLFEVVHVSGNLPDPASVFDRGGIGVCDRFVFYHWRELERSTVRRNFTGSTRLYQPFAYGTPTYMLPRRELCQPGRLQDVYPPGSLMGWAHQPPKGRRLASMEALHRHTRRAGSAGSPLSCATHFLASSKFPPATPVRPPMAIETTVCSAWNYSLTFPRGRRCGYGYNTALYESILKHESCGVVLDVGANWGQSMLPLLSRGWRLIAFEPVRETAEHAAFNLAQNHIPQTRGVVISAAASNRTGWSSVYLPKRDDNAALSAKAAIANVGGATKELHMRSIRLDDYLASIEDVSDIRAAKIDVQGHELEVLQGLGHYLHTLRPVLIVENDGKLQREAGHMPNDVRRFLEAVGYAPFCLHKGILLLEPPGVPRCYDVIYRFASLGSPARPPMALDASGARGLKVGCDHPSSVCDANGNEPSLLVFLHIPKAAGTSALSDLRNRGYRTSKLSQAEPCLRDVHCPSQGAIHFTLLRSPRDHILSQYHMCRDSEWGRQHASALPATFEAWLDHFLTPNNSRLDAFNCYNPWNMQARALTCSVANSPDKCEKWHGLTFGQKCELWGSELHRPTRMATLEPPVPSALSSLDLMVQLAGQLLRVCMFLCPPLLILSSSSPQCSTTNLLLQKPSAPD
jgi:FkbM family methyltransferase